jgi:hypothetical protein
LKGGEDMKQFYWLRTKMTKLFLKILRIKSDTMRKYSFKTKTMNLGDSYALLAVICPIRTAVFELSRGKSALFSIGSINSKDLIVSIKSIEDCFECLLPHNTAAA